MPLVQARIKRYVPDLMSLQRTCEVNYSRVLIDGALRCR